MTATQPVSSPTQKISTPLLTTPSTSYWQLIMVTPLEKTPTPQSPLALHFNCLVKTANTEAHHPLPIHTYCWVTRNPAMCSALNSWRQTSNGHQKPPGNSAKLGNTQIHIFFSQPATSLSYRENGSLFFKAPEPTTRRAPVLTYSRLLPGWKPCPAQPAAGSHLALI